MENLLDKFIRNEKKAKLWALLSLLAFFTAAATVVVVAYNIKYAQAGQSGGTTTVITDTVFISMEDTATTVLLNEQSETIRLLRDTCKYLQDNYQLQLQEVEKYMGLWKECQSKPPCGEPPPPPPPPVQPVSVIIYTSDASQKTIDKLRGLTQKSQIDNYKIDVTIQQASGKNKPGIRYSDSRYQKQAESIANMMNNSKAFSYWKNLIVIPGNPVVMKADIELWLEYVN